MAISITHAFVSGKADPPDASLIKPSNWNAAHTLTMASGRLVGRTTAASGAAEEISVSGALTFSAQTLSLASNAITNTYLADMATQTFKGRTTSGTGDPEDLTVTQATAMLNTFTSSLKGLAPASGGGTTNFLRADGSWAVPPTAALADGSVTTAKLADTAVTNAKMAYDNGPLSGFRNRLINGDFRIAQRPNGTYADDQYIVSDRWYALTQTSFITPSVQTDQENGSPYNMRLNQDQATAQRMGVAQIIEGINCKDLRGQSVVLSARVRCSAATTIRYAILEWTGTVDVVTSDVVLTWTSGTYAAGGFFLASNLTVAAVGSTALSANTWTQLTDLTGTITSSMNNIVVFIWTESAVAQNVTLDIAQVQLEQGAKRTAFERRSWSAEYLLCQRYYETGAQPVWYNSAFGSLGGTSGYGTICLMVYKRVNPTVSTSGWQYYNGGTGTAYTPGWNASPDRIWHYTDSATNYSGEAGTGTWAANAEL